MNRPSWKSGHGSSLMRGGPVYRLLHRAGFVRPGVRTARLIAMLLLSLTVLPLVVITGMDGTLLAGKVRIPLSGDYYVLARFVLVLPLLVLAAPMADALLRSSLRQLGRSGVIQPIKRDALAGALHAARMLRDARSPEIICLLLALLPALFAPMPLGDLQHLDSWSWSPATGPSRAAQWLTLVSQPLFRFVMLVWVWRFLMWTYVLWRASRIGLDLRPAHPDAAGGLAFLGVAQERFSVLALAGGLILSGNCMNHLVYGQQALTDVRHLVFGYIVAATALLMAPLLLMAPSMMRAKRHALARYGAMAHQAARHFDLRWRRVGASPPDGGALLDSGEPSALADFASVYGALKAMSVVPVTRWNLLATAFAAAVPFAPLVFFAMSLDQLAQKLFSILL